jgi:hypothetical protein
MIRKARQSDAEKIEKILKKISQFTSVEIDIAMELVRLVLIIKHKQITTFLCLSIMEKYLDIIVLASGL